MRGETGIAVGVELTPGILPRLHNLTRSVTERPAFAFPPHSRRGPGAEHGDDFIAKLCSLAPICPIDEATRPSRSVGLKPTLSDKSFHESDLAGRLRQRR